MARIQKALLKHDFVYERKHHSPTNQKIVKPNSPNMPYRETTEKLPFLFLEHKYLCLYARDKIKTCLKHK